MQEEMAQGEIRPGAESVPAEEIEATFVGELDEADEPEAEAAPPKSQAEIDAEAAALFYNPEHIHLHGKAVDLEALSAELDAAGIAHRALGMHGEGDGHVLYTYNEVGEQIPLPPEALAVVDAHVPPPPPPTREQLVAAALDKAIHGIQSARSAQAQKEEYVSGLTTLRDIFAGGS